MEEKKPKKLIDILAKRSELSVWGKAIIGVVGGVLLLFVSLIKKCQQHDSYYNKEEATLDAGILGPISRSSTDSNNNDYYQYFDMGGLRTAKLDSMIVIINYSE